MKLITFLGTGKYQKTHYYAQTNTQEYVNTAYIQEAIIRLKNDIDEVIIVATERAKSLNWEDYDDSEGLKTILESTKIKYTLVNIPDGKQQEELWEMFQLIYEVIEENDQLMIDVTHSFRSIPFIIMSIIEYAKMMKNIDVLGIYYGAFEAKDQDNHTPIFNLNFFTDMMDWSHGVDQLIQAGDYKKISNKMKSVMKPLLKEAKGQDQVLNQIRQLVELFESFFVGLKLSRGKVVTEDGHMISHLLSEIDEVKIPIKDYESLRPFFLIMEKIREPFNDFYDADLVKNIHSAVKLCGKYELYQQAYTLLRENIVNMVCVQGELEIYNHLNDRLMAENVIKSFINSDYLQEHDAIVLSPEEKNIRDKVEGTFELSLATLFKDIGDYRNDFNHAEFRLNSIKANKLKSKLDEFILIFENALDKSVRK